MGLILKSLPLNLLSPILSKGIKGAHNVEGVGLGFIPAIYNSEYVDDVISIEESLARQTCKENRRKEYFVVLQVV